MYTTSDFRQRAEDRIRRGPFVHRLLPAREARQGGAFVRTKLKEPEDRRGDRAHLPKRRQVEKPDLEEREMQFMYKMEGQFHFMTRGRTSRSTSTRDTSRGGGLSDRESPREDPLLQGRADRDRHPFFIDLKIVETEPGVRGTR